MSADRSLYQILREYAAGDVYPCHMPGHKRNSAGGEMVDFFGIDITEIEGFDNLHHATGILKEAQERANCLYGADETFFLVNGSTGGILAAVMAAARPGEEILIARNCHRSVYHAALMQNLKVHYYQPRLIEEYNICDGVSADAIGKLLDECPEIRAVVITSPTYEGILSDVAGIAAAVHDRDRILIVDEAHGAHLGHFTGMDGAVAAGADLVIHSLHKTLPSLTQTALLHVNGNQVDRGRLRSYLAMVQSSSPSYILMAAMDACVRFLEKDGRERFAFFRERQDVFLKKTADLKHIHIGKMTDVSESGCAMAGWDIGKILISVKNADMTGNQLADILRKTYHIELEMAAATYGLALMTLMDTAEGWQRLADALHEIDDRIEKEHSGRILSQRKLETSDRGLQRESEIANDRPQREAGDAEETGVTVAMLPEAVMTLAQAFHSEREEVMVQEAAGRISADFINLYPPGIPLAAPGERLTQALLDDIADNLKKGFVVHGVSPAGGIRVVVEIPEKIWHY